MNKKTKENRYEEDSSNPSTKRSNKEVAFTDEYYDNMKQGYKARKEKNPQFLSRKI